jgi:hypothetical protein
MKKMCFLKKKHIIFHVFPFSLIVDVSKVCRMGTHWMKNLILHPRSAYT